MTTPDDNDSDKTMPVPSDPLPPASLTGVPNLGAFARVLPFYLREVVDAVRSGAVEVPGAATFADGLQTQRVLDAARRSHAERRAVRI